MDIFAFSVLVLIAVAKISTFFLKDKVEKLKEKHLELKTDYMNYIKKKSELYEKQKEALKNSNKELYEALTKEEKELEEKYSEIVKEYRENYKKLYSLDRAANAFER